MTTEPKAECGEAVAKQIRHTFADGSWGGWTTFPPEGGGLFAANMRNAGFVVETRDLYLHPTPSAVEALARAADGWMPIESAPKDTMILVGPTKRMDMCVARLTERDGWETETPGEWVAIYTPTHWMPLPAVPQAQGKGK